MLSKYDIYDTLASKEVSVMYRIGSSSLLSDEKRDKKSETNICSPEFAQNQMKNLIFPPKMSEYRLSFLNNKYISKLSIRTVEVEYFNRY